MPATAVWKGKSCFVVPQRATNVLFTFLAVPIVFLSLLRFCAFSLGQVTDFRSLIVNICDMQDRFATPIDLPFGSSPMCLWHSGCPARASGALLRVLFEFLVLSRLSCAQVSATKTAM